MRIRVWAGRRDDISWVEGVSFWLSWVGLGLGDQGFINWRVVRRRRDGGGNNGEGQRGKSASWMRTAGWKADRIRLVAGVILLGTAPVPVKATTILLLPLLYFCL